MTANDNHDEDDPCGAVLSALYRKDHPRAISLLNKREWNDKERQAIWMGIFHHDGLQACMHVLNTLRWNDGISTWDNIPVDKKVFLLPVFEDVLKKSPQEWLVRAKQHISNFEIKNACMLFGAASLRGVNLNEVVFSETEQRKMFSAVANSWIASRSIGWIEHDPFVLLKNWLFQEVQSATLFEKCWSARIRELYDEGYWNNNQKEELNALDSAFQKNMIVVRSGLDGQLNVPKTRKKIIL